MRYHLIYNNTLQCYRERMVIFNNNVGSTQKKINLDCHLTPYIKTNSRNIVYPNVNGKTIKLLEKKHKRTNIFMTLEWTKSFNLNRPPKALTIRKKIDKLNNIRNFCSSNRHH